MSRQLVRAAGDHAPPRGSQRDQAALRRGGDQRLSGPACPRVSRDLGTFRKLIPLLAASHRVFAVDLRGFGDSGNEPARTTARRQPKTCTFSSAPRLGPVHLTGQGHQRGDGLPPRDRAPGRRAQSHAIEMGLPGFGWRCWPDVTHGGTWHIGSSPRPASRKCCSPAASASSWEHSRSRR